MEEKINEKNRKFNLIDEITSRLDKKHFLSFFKKIFLTFLVLTPLFAYIGGSLLLQYNSPIEKAPYVHWSGLDPSSHVFISWETEEESNSIVEYGTAPTNLIFMNSSSELVKMHRVTIGPLAPNTKYYYKVKDTQNVYESEIHSFKTATNDSSIEFNITVISDTQQMWGTGHYNTIATAIANFEDTDFVAYAGDLAQTEDNDLDWNYFWEETSKFSDTTPIIATPGNHDDPDNPESLYYKYFGNTTKEMDLYYTFNYASAQIVMMHIANGGDCDREAIDEDGDASNERAYSWLEDTLEIGLTKEYRIVMFHRQVFSALGNGEDLIEDLVPLMQHYNVSMVIYGHMHQYERFYHNGINYLCQASGGGLQNTIARPQESSQIVAMGPIFTKLYFTQSTVTLKSFSAKYDIVDEVIFNLENNRLVPNWQTTYGGLND